MRFVNLILNIVRVKIKLLFITHGKCGFSILVHLLASAPLLPLNFISKRKASPLSLVNLAVATYVHIQHFLSLPTNSRPCETPLINPKYYLVILHCHVIYLNMPQDAPPYEFFPKVSYMYIF